MTEPAPVPAPFEPDWDKIYDAWLQPEDDEYNRTYALPQVITEYQRQLAAAGMVVVRREELLQLSASIEDAMKHLNNAHRLAYQRGIRAIGREIHAADTALRDAQEIVLTSLAAAQDTRERS